MRVVAVQPDGKILIGGDFTSYNGVTRNRIARLNCDGSLDTSFHPGPGLNGTGWAVLPLSDGRLAVGGQFENAGGVSRPRIAIFKADGTHDTSFTPATGFNNTVLALREMPGGRLVAGGFFTQFNSTNVGRIAAAGFAGSLVSAFNSSGTGFNAAAEVLVPVPGDKLLALGEFTQFNGAQTVRAALLDADGAIDGSFNAGNNINGAVLGGSRQGDGKYLLSGSFTCYGATPRQRVVRLNTAAGQAVAVRENGWVDAAAANIKTLSVLSPALGSNGHGRWHGDGAAVAKAVLTDRRTVVLDLDQNGAQTPLLAAGTPATAVDPGTQWVGFGLPAISLDGALAVAGTVKSVANIATTKTDTMLLCSADGQNFTVVAREGTGSAPGAGTATFASFFDPLTNNGDVAIMATRADQGVKSASKTGIWWGAPAALEKVARLSELAPDRSGAIPTPPQTGSAWKAFTSYALPAGQGAGPIFIAKVGGKGVTASNNLGISAVDSGGMLREILRTGPIEVGVGELKTLKKFTTLNAPAGAFGATRSFNAAGSIAVQATFSDKSQALFPIDIP